MTEIKRLSDEDIEKLKMVQEEPVCTGCPIAGGICGNIIKESECHLNCHDVSKTAIRLEMEAREREKMVEKNQLPTESELRAELENACDNLNKLWGQNSFRVEKNGNGILLWHDNGCTVVGAPLVHRFRPDIEPPAKYRSVFVRLSNGRTLTRVSGGKMSESGKYLMTICDAGEGNMMTYTNWCDCLDTSKHSAGWDMAWIEGVV